MPPGAMFKKRSKFASEKKLKTPEFVHKVGEVSHSMDFYKTNPVMPKGALFARSEKLILI